MGGPPGAISSSVTRASPRSRRGCPGDRPAAPTGAGGDAVPRSPRGAALAHHLVARGGNDRRGLAMIVLLNVDVIGWLERPILPYLNGHHLGFTHPGDPFQ